MILKNLYRKAKFYLERNGVFTPKGEQVKEAFDYRMKADKKVDHCVFGDSLVINTEGEIEAMVKKGIKQLQKRAMADGEVQPTFIVDVFNIHEGPNTNPALGPLGKIPERQAETAIESLHDAFRNQGHHEASNGVDTGINFRIGKFYQVDGTAAWGSEWLTYGVNYASGPGISPHQISDHCKNLDPETDYSQGRRFAIFTYRKIYNSGAVGFAYVAASAIASLSGSFVRYDYLGDRRYEENDEAFKLTASTNKTTIHEVGHSLGLWHTFHNTDDCKEETNPLIEGDRIADTPSHSRTNNCGYAIDELPRNSHMSYSYHSARIIFSQGQSDRMNAVVANRFPNMVQNTAPDIPGCTDPNATNYDPAATLDDGTCEYEVLGCTDESALNYNPEATQDDGSCIQRIPGCMDKDALNYDSKATVDDGSCEYEVLGCMDKEALNYNPDATKDDGSCKYDQVDPPEPPTIDDRFDLLEADHIFSTQPVKGYSGCIYYLDNDSGGLLPISVDECGGVNDGCIISKLKDGKEYVVKGVVDQKTGIAYPTDHVGLAYIDGKVGFTFDHKLARIVIPGITWSDYTFSVYFKQLETPSGVNSFASKRENYSNSDFYLFTWDKHSERLHWDNTRNNRIDLGINLSKDLTYSLIASRNTGFYVDGHKETPPLQVTEVENSSDLVIGNDLSQENRNCGAVIYEFSVSKKSIPEEDILAFTTLTNKVYTG